MIKVALTGGIGAGKTTVARLFQALGVPVYFSDQQAKCLMGGILKPQIEAAFGLQAYNSNGTLNTKYISSIVFSNAELLQKLNSLVHPAVEDDFCKWAYQQEASYVIIETALLMESKLNRTVDKIITVVAPLQTRITRAACRDNLPAELICERIAAQTPQNELESISNYIIDTTEGRMILPTVIELHTKLSEIANCKK